MEEELSEEDRDVITQHPLNDMLEISVMRSRKVQKRPAHLTHGAYRRIIVSLLTDLRYHEVARILPSTTGHNVLFSELSLASNRIELGLLDEEHFRPVLDLILDGAPDVAIWSAMFSTLRALALETPPPNPERSINQPPPDISSSSFEQREENRLLLEDILFEEFQKCTFHSIPGVFTKYFEGKSWGPKSDVIFAQAKQTEKQNGLKWYRHGRWTGLPDLPEENIAWAWLSQFQEEFFSDSQHLLCRKRSTANLCGTEAERQLQILVKKRSAAQGHTDGNHRWIDALAFAVHERSPRSPKELLLQMGRCAQDVFNAQPTRRFILSFALHGPLMEVWVFDRSGAYTCPHFNIHREPVKFVDVLTGLTNMSDAELGLDTFVQWQDDDCFITINNASGEEMQLQLEPEPFVKRCNVVGRGTTCFYTVDQKTVVKFSWAFDQQHDESDLLRTAQEKKVEGVAAFVGYKRIATIEELRSGLEFSRPYKFKGKPGSAESSLSLQSLSPSQPQASDSPKPIAGTSKRGPGSEEDELSKRPRHSPGMSSLRNEYKPEEDMIGTVSDLANVNIANKASMATGLYDMDKSDKFCNRIFGCLAISPAGRPLRTFISVRELLTALRDTISAHRSLFLKGNILHRDISENNIIITKPDEANGFTGMLIDLDLAKELSSGRSVARHKTGTIEFMAIEVLEKGVHTYRHDLESFLHVLIWMCARRSWEVKYRCQESDRPQPDIFTSWYTGTLEEIANTKRGRMDEGGFESVLLHFPRSLQNVKLLCRKIRNILFGSSGGINVGTHTDAPALYDKIIYAYNQTLKEESLEMD